MPDSQQLDYLRRLVHALENAGGTEISTSCAGLFELVDADRCLFSRFNEERNGVSVVCDLNRGFSLTLAGQSAHLEEWSWPEARSWLMGLAGTEFHAFFAVGDPSFMGGVLSLHRSGKPVSDVDQAVADLFSRELSRQQERLAARSALDEMSRQLWLERSARAISQRLYASLDRDRILQSLVDLMGSLMKVDCCMFVRTDTAAPTVTHEYVSADLSPLGLGSTGSLPEGLLERFAERTNVCCPVAPPHSCLTDCSWLGTPVCVDGTTCGIILLQAPQSRQWSKGEVQLLDAVAGALGSSLQKARIHKDLSDQIFHLKIAGQLSEQLAQMLEGVQHTLAEHSKELPPRVPIPLSAREMEVLRLIAGGLANREIAQRLFLTESTVELHASRIRKKLKLKSRTALVKFACDNNLV